MIKRLQIRVNKVQFIRVMSDFLWKLNLTKEFSFLAIVDGDSVKPRVKTLGLIETNI